MPSKLVIFWNYEYLYFSKLWNDLSFSFHSLIGNLMLTKRMNILNIYSIRIWWYSPLLLLILQYVTWKKKLSFSCTCNNFILLTMAYLVYLQYTMLKRKLYHKVQWHEIARLWWLSKVSTYGLSKKIIRSSHTEHDVLKIMLSWFLGKMAE